MPDPRVLAWLDCETTSTRPGRRPWDIAVIRRPADADPDGDTSYQVFIDRRDLDLADADLKALEIGRFYERHPEFGAGGNVMRLADALHTIEGMLRGAVVLGSNPSFDTETLDPFMRGHAILPSWYYHPVDIPSMVEGWLRGARRPVPQPPKTDPLIRAIGIDPDSYPRHTALGDCQLFRAVYDTITNSQQHLPKGDQDVRDWPEPAVR